jgi:TolB protein
MNGLSRRKLLLAASSAAMLALAGLSGAAQAQPLRIAISEFVGEPDASRSIAGAIASNLQRSGLFAPVDPGAFIEKITSIDVAPRFEDWRAINAQALVMGRVQRQADGRFSVTFRLWDVSAGHYMLGQQFLIQPENWQRVADLISDGIYERLTGKNGNFDSTLKTIRE